MNSHKKTCIINCLDGQELAIELKKKCKGMLLMDKVCDSLGIDEKEYFGLKYINPKDKKFNWLDLEKSIGKQIGRGTLTFTFAVKFFPPTPNALQQDITRYHFVLQLRQDLLRGRLVCSTPIHALLASYIIQAELGNYEDVTENNYLAGFQFMPDQGPEFLEKVKEFHRKHTGLNPSDAEYQYLENARKLPLYGIELHEGYDKEKTEIFVGASHQGIHIVKQGRQINKFAWPCVMKIGFQKKNFLLDIRAVSETEFEDMVVILTFKTRTELKRMYRTAVDNHTFFRRSKPVSSRRSGNFFHLGSKFRYSGRRTFIQTKNADYNTSQSTFVRVSSQRFSQSILASLPQELDSSQKSHKHCKDLAQDGKGDESSSPASPSIIKSFDYAVDETKLPSLPDEGVGTENEKAKDCNGL